jgi:hypothetical protein
MTLFAPPRESAVLEADIPEGLRQYLETGELPGREAPGYRDALRLRFFGRAGELTFEDVWHSARDVVLAEWASERPGTRPWAWWAVEAREVLGAAEVGRVRREGPGESEASFLKRHGLLLPGEEQRVPKAAWRSRSAAEGEAKG